MGKHTPLGLKSKLARIARQSTLSLLAVLLAQIATAHEIRPASANIEVSVDRADISILLSLEPLIAGINLAEVTDTNASPLADRYDALRADDPAVLEEKFRAAWPGIAANIRLKVGETTLPLTLDSLEVTLEPDISLAREAVLRLSTALPPGDSPVTLGWDISYGPLVVRQVLSEGGGYAGYLTGGEDSALIPRTGSAEQNWLSAFMDYIGIGFEHIVPKGLDHILFVLGLFFFSLNLRPLLYQVTAFTVAHTATHADAIPTLAHGCRVRFRSVARAGIRIRPGRYRP